MNNLKDIHNCATDHGYRDLVVLSGCQWTIWRIYTTTKTISYMALTLFYQDVNEQFEGYTQRGVEGCTSWSRCFIRMSMNNLKDIHNCPSALELAWRVVLSGCQWTIWRIYTTQHRCTYLIARLFYQDVNEQFEGYTQPTFWQPIDWCRCFIRMSMNNLKDIHNSCVKHLAQCRVVLSGCQWTIWRIYTTGDWTFQSSPQLFYQDVNEQFEGYTQLKER